MNKQIVRLEGALRAWEDFCFALGVNARMQLAWDNTENIIPLTGPIRYGQEIRQHLLGLRNLDEFDDSKFLLPMEISEKLPQQAWWLRMMGLFPLALAAWTCNSRRVYQVSEELQVLLGATSLGDTRWSDVSWPFESFAVTFDLPVEYYDCVLVSKFVNNDIPAIAFYLLPTTCNEQRAIGHRRKKEMLELMQKKRWHELLSLLKNHEKGARLPGITAFSVMADDDRRVTESVTNVAIGQIVGGVTRAGYEAAGKIWNTAVRLVVGLCLYLQTLPPGPSSERSGWKPGDKTIGLPDKTAITDGSQICTVFATLKIGREDREAMGIGEKSGRTFGELCAHFREGHWRRRPGQGHDPNAPRCVHVKPTLVRRDRLPNGAVPKGSEKLMS